jgi:hypothetical protein
MFADAQQARFAASAVLPWDRQATNWRPWLHWTVSFTAATKAVAGSAPKPGMVISR